MLNDLAEEFRDSSECEGWVVPCKCSFLTDVILRSYRSRGDPLLNPILTIFFSIPTYFSIVIIMIDMIDILINTTDPMADGL